jgi:superfamily II DNA or RNA helicase
LTPYAESRIEAFQNRTLRDSRRVKKAPMAVVEATLKRRRFKPPVDLWDIQKRCAVIGTKFPAYIFLLDMGLGKTMLTLSLLDYRLKRGEVERAIVVTPFASVIDEWRRECEKFPA